MPGLAGFKLNNQQLDFNKTAELLSPEGPRSDDMTGKKIILRESSLYLSAVARPFIPVSKIIAAGRYHSLLWGELYPVDNYSSDKTIRDGHRQLVEHLVHEGPQALNTEDGRFLLAVWDIKEQTLLLANDPFGLVPLNYYAGPEGFVFSSRLTSLARIFPGIALDELVIAERIALGFPLNGSTFLKNVKRLPPGYVLQFRTGQLSLKRYFEPIYQPSARPISERLEDISSAFEQSLAMRYRPSDKTGISLSGGFDTRLIWSVARDQQLAAKAVTHGLINSADMQIAGDIAKRTGLDQIRFSLDDLQWSKFPEWADQLIGMSDGLMNVSSAFLIPYYSELEKKLDVLIDGAGGAIYRRQHASKLEWVQNRNKAADRFIFDLFRKPLFSGELLRNGFFTQYKPAIQEELKRYFSEIETFGSKADQVDLFYLQQIVGLQYSADFLLQTNYINCREPFYDRQTYALARQFTPAERKKLYIHRYILERHQPRLKNFPLEFSDYPIPYHGFLWKRAVPPALEKISGGRFHFHKKAEPLLHHGQLIRGPLAAYFNDILLNPAARYREFFHQTKIEAMLQSHHNGSADFSSPLLLLLSIELMLARFS